MSTLTTRRFYARRFLNRRGHHAGAYVLASIEVDAPTERRPRPWIDATVTIADCGRVITLECGGTTRAEVSNSLRKARLLHDVLGDFIAALDAVVEESRTGTSSG